ncbi:MFS transporter [Kitasatospora xanthocidica]|uniref:MFS transporter n=1 Tax=Kitasatospora xanthocidica TaxID=83382 RepID=UPI00167BBD95|nr:MFS transporter [Kitasatospora xanthocidica]GHF92085.1 MFS transporter [Kitasatospora xanthocidica]
MSDLPLSAPTVVLEATRITSEASQPSRIHRLGPVLLLAHFGWLLPAAAGATLIQALLSRLDDHAKLADYAALSGIGAVAAMLANIVFGTLSDRTRSRFGRRNPWILGGGLVAAASLGAMSLAHGFAALVAEWLVFQIALNAFLGPLIAILPDRVGRADLGKASSYVGAGQLLAQSLGGVVAGFFLAVPASGLRWLPWTLAAAAVLVFALAPERSNRDQPRERFSPARFLRSLLPPADADFARALVGRFLGILSLAIVLLYQLYTLTDYLHLDTPAAGRAIATGGLVTAIASVAAIAVSGPLSDRWGRRKALVIAASLIMGAAVLPLALAPSLWAYYAFMAVGGLGYGAYIAVDQALMAEVLPDHAHRAKDLGILNLANTAPQIAAPLIALAVVPAFGFRALFAVAALSAVAGALCIGPIRRVR